MYDSRKNGQRACFFVEEMIPMFPKHTKKVHVEIPEVLHAVR